MTILAKVCYLQFFQVHLTNWNEPLRKNLSADRSFGKIANKNLQGSWNMKIKWMGMDTIVLKTNHMPYSQNVNKT
jgi:hypothetical protein